MEHSSGSYLSLLIIVVLAAFVPIFVKKIRYLPIPVVVGEIIAGMIVGKSGFNLIEPTVSLDFLTNFGFAFLMFLSGLEIDLDLLFLSNEGTNKNWFERPVFIASVIFISTLLLSGIISYGMLLLGWISSAPLMSLILSTTSLGIVVPILKEKELLGSAYGQDLLLSAIIADFVTMFLITVYVVIYTSGKTYQVLLVFLLFLAFVIFYRLGTRIIKSRLMDELAHATTQIQVRGVFALILIFISLAQELGTEIILGAFLAGLVISLLRQHHTAQHLLLKLDAIGYGFFIPIFFIMVGAKFDILTVIENPTAIYLLPALLIAIYVVKMIPSLFFKIKYSLHKTIGAGFLLSSRLSLIIAASSIGLQLGAVTESTNAAIILVAIFSCTFSPIIFDYFVPLSDRTQEETVFVLGLSDRVFILAQRLQKAGKEVVLVTGQNNLYNKARQVCDKVFYGDLLNVDWLRQIGIEKAQTIVISGENEERNTELTKLCKEVFFKDHVVLFTNKQSLPEGSRLYGALTVSTELAALYMAENLVLHPQTFSIFMKEHEDVVIDEVVVRNPAFFNIKFKNVKLPGDCLVMSLIRNSEKIIPHGNNIIQEADLFMIVGSVEYVKVAHKLLGYPQ